MIQNKSYNPKVVSQMKFSEPCHSKAISRSQVMATWCNSYDNWLMTRTSPHYEDLHMIPSSFRTPWPCPPLETVFSNLPTLECETRTQQEGISHWLITQLTRHNEDNATSKHTIQQHCLKATQEEQQPGAWKGYCLLTEAAQSAIKKMCLSFIRRREEWGKLGHCPGQMRQSSVFCIWCFMSVPEIEPLNQTPLCEWGRHCALYNFTVGIAFCSHSDINLSQFCWQGFTYFTNSNWMYLTFVLILYPKHKASPEGKFYPLFHKIPKTLSSN